MHAALEEIKQELLNARRSPTHSSQSSETPTQPSLDLSNPSSPIHTMISTDPSTIDNHATSSWSTSNTPIKPFAVI
ncbi:hypothetical protein PMZ80_006869 [Knufia obscura]|uniref:Uncharacterized protein n=2 Tax=Knufia TaxID=430999 RepID=A0AAN8I8H6_9EURO|nr:hypothetical protein PMZ80_006869 [Knufia obscura]KAK5957409.1 hypothetical protein OHC33_001783 [Knufia fluminis]